MNPRLFMVETQLNEHGDELPQGFRVGEKQLRVVEVLDRWYQGRGDPEWPAANYYKVLADDQHVYMLKHELEANVWFLVRQW